MSIWDGGTNPLPPMSAAGVLPFSLARMLQAARHTPAVRQGLPGTVPARDPGALGAVSHAELVA